MYVITLPQRIFAWNCSIAHEAVLTVTEVSPPSRFVPFVRGLMIRFERK
jgi:hypothetical protein